MNWRERQARAFRGAADHARKLAAECLAEGDINEAVRHLDRARFYERHAAQTLAAEGQEQAA